MKRRFLQWLNSIFSREKKETDRGRKFIEGVTPQFANNFHEIIGKYIGFNAARQDVKTGEFEVLQPKILYGWNNPDTSLKDTEGWFILAVHDRIFEFAITIEQGKEPDFQQVTNEALTIEEFKEKILCGDFSEMINIESDKTVNDELEELFSKY